MDTFNQTTVDRLTKTTVDRTTSSTVVKTNQSTVVKMTTNLEQSCLGSSSSSSEQETVRLRSLLAPHVGLIDDDAVPLTTTVRRPPSRSAR